MRATPNCMFNPSAISPYEPAQEQATQEDFEQDHATSHAYKKTGQADELGLTPVSGDDSLLRHDHAGFGNRSGLAPALLAGNRPTISPFCHWPTAQGLALR